MGNFDRTPKAISMAIPAKPERLTRLDRDLESGSKQVDFVYAVRNSGFENYRVRVAVTEMGRIAQAERGFRFMATAFVGGKRHRSFGHRPSHAFIKVVEQLKWTTSRISWEQNTERRLAA